MDDQGTSSTSKRSSPQGTRRIGKLIVVLAALAVASLLTPHARAQLTLGNAAQFGILINPNVTATLNNPDSNNVHGNIGVGTGAKLTLSGSSGTVFGNIYYVDTISVGTNFKQGGWTLNP